MQAPIMAEEFIACEESFKRADPRWQEGMRKRGVTDFELVMIDPWPAGYSGRTMTTTTARRCVGRSPSCARRRASTATRARSRA